MSVVTSCNYSLRLGIGASRVRSCLTSMRCDEMRCHQSTDSNFRSYSIVVNMPPCHGEDRGSIPLGTAKQSRGSPIGGPFLKERVGVKGSPLRPIIQVI